MPQPIAPTVFSLADSVAAGLRAGRRWRALPPADFLRSRRLRAPWHAARSGQSAGTRPQLDPALAARPGDPQPRPTQPRSARRPADRDNDPLLLRPPLETWTRPDKTAFVVGLAGMLDVHAARLIKQADLTAPLERLRARGAFAARPFTHTLLDDLQAELGTPRRTRPASLPPARTEPALTARDAGPLVAPFRTHCASCHDTTPAAPAQLPARRSGEVEARLDHCAPRMFVRSAWPHPGGTTHQTTDATAAALAGRGIDTAHWAASPELAVLKRWSPAACAARIQRACCASPMRNFPPACRRPATRRTHDEHARSPLLRLPLLPLVRRRADPARVLGAAIRFCPTARDLRRPGRALQVRLQPAASATWAFPTGCSRCCPSLPRPAAKQGLRLARLHFRGGTRLPVGMSKRRHLGIDRVFLNCAVCHTATVRVAPNAKPMLVAGMPANQLDLMGLPEIRPGLRE